MSQPANLGEKEDSTMNEKKPMPKNSIYLCAPVNALVEGIYEQKIGFDKIRRHGDFGLGTFDGLDGELVLLDGIIYQVDGEGKVHIIEEQKASTPFACVTFFRPFSQERIEGPMSHEDFLRWLGQQMPSPNIFYAFRITGRFDKIRVRSVSKQESLRPLVEITEEQSEFSYTDVEGTIAGFHTPVFMSSLNVLGLHLHFISGDKQTGGHLLECEPRQALVEVQLIPECQLSLPMTLDYLTLDFKRDTEKDLDKAER